MMDTPQHREEQRPYTQSHLGAISSFINSDMHDDTILIVRCGHILAVSEKLRMGNGWIPNGVGSPCDPRHEAVYLKRNNRRLHVVCGITFDNVNNDWTVIDVTSSTMPPPIRPRSQNCQMSWSGAVPPCPNNVGGDVHQCNRLRHTDSDIHRCDCGATL